VSFRRLLWEVLGVYGLAERNRGKSREGECNLRDVISTDYQATAAADRENSGFKPIHLQIHRYMSPVFQDFEESIRME
jgi:hypothetical protein